MSTQTASEQRRDRHPLTTLLGALWRGIRAQPFSSGVAALILLLALLAHTLFGSRNMLRWDMGTGYEPLLQEGHWWSPVTSVFFTGNLTELILVLLLTIGLLGTAERMIGLWRTAFVFFASAIIGPLAGVGLQVLGSSRGEIWSRQVTELTALDPLTPIAGSLMAASGFAPVLWRRRIRVFTLLIAIVFLLYSGQPADLYRLLAVIAGLLLGMGLRRDKQVIHWVRSSQHEIRVLLASIVAVTALGPAIALFSRSRFGPLAPISLLLGNQTPNATHVLSQCRAFDVTRHCLRDLTLTRINNPGAILLSALPLILLLLASYGMLRGRRFALWVAAAINALLGLLSAFYFGLLPVSGLPYVIKRPTAAHWEVTLGLLISIVLPLLITAALIILRKNFPSLASARRISSFLLTVTATGLGLAVVYVAGGLLVRDTAFTTAVNLADLLGDVAERFVPVSFLQRETIVFLPYTPIGAVIYYGIGPAFWIITIIAAARAIADAPSRQQPGALGRIRSLLAVGGGDALSFMATWPGNRYWFDPEEGFAVAYRLQGRVALTLGGPFGALQPKDKCIKRFARYCDDNGWIPVFYSIDGSFQGLFRSISWSTMVVAEETIIRPAAWKTTGKKWQDVRTSINRAQRAGITAVWTNYASLSITTANQLAEISEQWVAEKDLPEMGFTLGGLDEIRDPDVRLMLAIDQDERVHAVTSWLPSYRNGTIIGWTLDFMRRRPDSAHGVMEFLIAEAAARMRDDGIEFLSLSGAPLAHTANQTEEDRAGIDRVLAYLSTSLEPMYGFRSLLNFKRKFQPEFHPLLMAYPDAAALPTIGIALTRAYLPTLSITQAATLASRKK